MDYTGGGGLLWKRMRRDSVVDIWRATYDSGVRDIPIVQRNVEITAEIDATPSKGTI